MKKEFIGYALAIISVMASGMFSWYFYDQSQQDRIPVYATDVFPTTAYDTDESDDRPFKVTLKSGEDLDKDIYLAEHFFWNKGNRPILESDVLEKLTITFKDEKSTLLDVRVNKMSRTVVDCKVSPVSSDKKSFSLTYRVLEEADGCSIKLFYTGNRYPDSVIESVIVGVQEVEIYSQSVDDYLDEMPWYSSYKRYLPGIFLLFIIGVCLFVIYKSNIKGKPIRLVFYFIFAAQLFTILELRLGNSSFFINSERPNTEKWATTNPNKSMQPTPKSGAAD
jgi:hypothetical protein